MFLPYSKHPVFITISNRLRTCGELIALCSENYAKHERTLVGKMQIFNVKADNPFN